MNVQFTIGVGNFAVETVAVSSASLSRELWPELCAPALREEAQEDHQDPEEVHQPGAVPPPLCWIWLRARQESGPAGGTARTLCGGTGAGGQEMWWVWFLYLLVSQSKNHVRGHDVHQSARHHFYWKYWCFSSLKSSDQTTFVTPNTRQQRLWLGPVHTVDS